MIVILLSYYQDIPVYKTPYIKFIHKMSGSKAESDIEEEDQDNETPLENENTLVLFDMKG